MLHFVNFNFLNLKAEACCFLMMRHASLAWIEPSIGLNKF